MDNSLKTGQYILQVLEDDQELIAKLGGPKIYPIILTEDNVNYPIIIYTRDNIRIDYTKGYNWDNTVTITYKIYSPDHDETLDIASRLRHLLEKKHIKFPNEININEIRLVGVYETFQDDVFCETLTFEMKVE